jgi:magnesium transporter
MTSRTSERVDLEQSVIETMSAVQTAVSVDMTVGEAVSELRSRRVTQPILYVYAIDDLDRLVGVVPIRALLLGDPKAAIRDVMTARTVTIRATETVGDALMAFAMYRLLALPVVDDEGRLLGAVDVQIYADETFELAEAQRVHQLFQMLGVSVREARDRSPWRGFRSRMPWLCWNLAGGTACAIIAKIFDATLTEFIVLAMFIPLVLTLAESVAMQSMTLVLEVLQGTEVRWRLIRRRLKTEAGTATLLGICCGTVVGGTSMLFGGGLGVGLILMGSIASAMVLAAAIGATVPTVLHALRLDPRIAAGPLSLTVTDILATTIYLSSATLFLMQ